MATEKRLIDANAIPWEEHYVPDPDGNAQWAFKKEKTVLKPVVDLMPTVDAVEVVRCKDCRWRKNGRLCYMISGCPEPVGTGDDFFCSYGERKDNART